MNLPTSYVMERLLGDRWVNLPHTAGTLLRVVMEGDDCRVSVLRVSSGGVVTYRDTELVTMRDIMATHGDEYVVWDMFRDVLDRMSTRLRPLPVFRIGRGAMRLR